MLAFIERCGTMSCIYACIFTPHAVCMCEEKRKIRMNGGLCAHIGKMINNNNPCSDAAHKIKTLNMLLNTCY